MIQPSAKTLPNNPFTGKASNKNTPNFLDTLLKSKPTTLGSDQPAKLQSNENEPGNLDPKQQDSKLTPSLITRNEILLKSSSIRKKTEANAIEVILAPSQEEPESESFSIDSLVVTVRKPREKVMQIDKRAELISTVLKCLQPMYKTIKNNSQSIKKQIHIKLQANRPHFIQLNSEQLVRLTQGFSFYTPISNKGITLLQQCFQKHPLGQQLHEVSKALSLDYLKSYYLLKEVYAHQLNYQPQGFTFIVQRGQLINTREVVELARQYLILDKKNLLECYLIMLNFEEKEILMKACTVREHLNLLWGFIHSMETEPTEIQEMVFSLYLKYSNFKDPSQPLFLQKQLFLMKKKMSKMSLHPSIKSQLQQMSVDEMLQKGNFKVEECSGHFRDLVQFIVYKRDIDFEQAINRLPVSERLSPKWMNYMKECLAQVSFPQDKRLNVLKAIYIYQVMIHLSTCSEGPPQRVQSNLLRAIVRLSIPFALYFLKVIRSISVKIWFIKTIVQCKEKQLKQSDQSILLLLERFVGSFQPLKIIQLLVTTTSRVVQQCLQSNDLLLLQTQISSGRSILYGFDPENTVYQIVKFYNKLFSRLPAQQEQIQSDIISLFKLLKSQSLNIHASFVSLDHCLLAKITNSYIIARHLSFAVQILDQIDTITRTVKGWLHRISQHSIQYYFDIFAEFFTVLAGKVVEAPGNLIAVEAFTDGIRVFRHSIYFYLCSQSNGKPTITSNQMKIMSMFYQIKEYYYLTQKAVEPDFQELFEELRRKISSRVNSPLAVLSSMDFDLLMSERLMLFHILTLPTPQNTGLNDKPKSKLLDLVQKEKCFNLCNLFSHISSKLKQQSVFDVLDLIYNAVEADQTLTKLIIKENGIIVSDLLVNLQPLSFLKANQMLKILISLYSYPVSQSQKLKYSVIIDTMQAKLGMWVQSASITQSTFVKIIQFLTRALNGLKYDQHMMFLEVGRRKGYLLRLPVSPQAKIQLYGLYVLCMMASLKRKAINQRDNKQLSKLKIDLTIFTELAMVMINSHCEVESREELTEFAVKYISKLFRLYLQSSKIPSLCFFIRQQLSTISVSIERYKNKFGQIPFLASQMASVLQSLGHRQLQSPFEDKFEEIEVEMIHDQSKFNNVFIRNVRVIDNQLKLDKIVHLLGKLISFLEVNSSMRLKLIGFNKTVAVRLLKQRQTSAVFLKALQSIMNMMNYEFARAKININFLEDVINQLNMNPDQSGHLQQILLDSIKLQTVITSLENSLVSIFFVRSSFNLQVLQLLQSLRGYLSIWGQSEESISPVLTATRVQLQWQPKGLKNYFNLWNLLEFRQKLGLLSSLLRYCLQMKGLNHLKQYNLVQTIMDYLKLFKRNEELMKSQSFAQNWKLITDFSSHTHIVPGSPFKFIRKSISYEQLKSMCAQIGESLNQLDCDFTEESLQFFSDFSIQLTS